MAVITLALGSLLSAQGATAASENFQVVQWGTNFGDIPAGLNDVTAISAGQTHSLALRSDGTVVAWGWNDYGQTEVPVGLTGVVAVSAGWAHSLALRGDGTVVAWGSDLAGQSDVPPGLANVASISAGGGHSLALLEDGTVVGWGDDEYGQATPPAGLSEVQAIAAGGLHSLALKRDGTVVGWGLGVYGATTPPPGLSGVAAIATSYFFSLALKDDGTVVAWGYDWEGETSVPSGLTDVVAISCGINHSLALRSDGTVVAWGNWFQRSSWSVPEGLSGVRAVSAGYEHSLAITAGVVTDSTAPVITWSSSTPADGAAYDYGMVPPQPTCSAVDDISGPVACTVSGYGTAVGSHVMTATATDAAGNATTQTRTYTVRAWVLKGFYAPVRTAGVWNTTRAGSTVPLKFEVFQGATELTRTSAITSTTQQLASCTTGAPTAGATPMASPGSSRLRYDNAAGRFVVGWKTPSTAGRCYMVTVTASDGSTLTARFRLN